MPVEKTSVLVLDCAEPQELADFYARLLGAETRPGADPDIVEVTGGQGVRLAARRDEGHIPQSWPSPADTRGVHLHILVPRGDMDEAEREAIGLGARPVEARDDGEPRDTRLYADPAGHPFALVAREGRAAG